MAGPADLPTLLVDLKMLTVTGGRERTEAEFRALTDAAGLELVAIGRALEPFGYRVIECQRSRL